VRSTSGETLSTGSRSVGEPAWLDSTDVTVWGTAQETHRPGRHDGVMSEHDDLHDHDKGLSHDLPQLVRRGLGRRGMLGIVGGVGVATLAGCALGDDGSSSASTASDRPSPPAGRPPDGGMGAESDVEVADGEIPEETAGPYPADGSNGVNVLTESGVVRRDITSSFGSASAVAEGVPATIRMKVYDLTGEDATVLAGAAVYVWHCDRGGEYSMYSDSVGDENYLRGVQEADEDGVVEFTSIFPGCYAGRWPHIHFEVYKSLAEATSAGSKLRTSQIAIPQDVCEEVYGGGEGYEQSVPNLAQLSLATDMVFADGYSLQLGKVTGSLDDGYTIALNVPV
jgi:protocatechuate 3,4-dioxygenase beta subunit